MLATLLVHIPAHIVVNMESETRHQWMPSCLKSPTVLAADDNNSKVQAESTRKGFLTAMHPAIHLPPALRQVSARAILYMVLSSFCFALLELTGYILVSDLSMYQIVWTRYVVHILFMVIVLGPRYKTTLVRSGSLKLQIVRSLTMLMMPVCFIVASGQMSPNNLWSVYWTSPLVMLALSIWVLREPVGMHRWLAALVGFGGMLLVHGPDQDIFSPAALLAFGSGVAISLHLMFSRILRHDHPITSLFHTALWVFLVLSFFVPFFWQPPSLQNLIGMVIIGMVGLLALLLLARSGELVSLAVVASFSYSEAVWNVLLSMLLLGIVPGKTTLLGLLLIVVVTGYLLVRETSTESPQPIPHIPNADAVLNKHP